MHSMPIVKRVAIVISGNAVKRDRRGNLDSMSLRGFS
jgi:hypothetical protein